MARTSPEKSKEALFHGTCLLWYGLGVQFNELLFYTDGSDMLLPASMDDSLLIEQEFQLLEIEIAIWG